MRTLADKVRSAFRPQRVRRAFKDTFATPSGKVVLAHLMDTCGATETTYTGSTEETLVAEGRRQVWLVVQDILSMTEEDARTLQKDVSAYGDDE